MARATTKGKTMTPLERRQKLNKLLHELFHVAYKIEDNVKLSKEIYELVMEEKWVMDQIANDKWGIICKYANTYRKESK